MKLVDWATELARSRYDAAAGIKIAKLVGDSKFSTYLAAIDPGMSVNAHYHREGEEHYHILNGHGEITLTDVSNSETERVSVTKNCSFTVPPNQVHRLKNTGDEPLVLMFSCPESHLAEDRYFL